MATPAAPLAANRPSGVTQNQAQGSAEDRWGPLLGLRCELTVDLPVPGFRVSEFLQLHPGSIVSTNWRLTRDVPLRVNGVQVAWGEFERAVKKLALRMTELV